MWLFYGENNSVVVSTDYGKSFRRLKNGLMVAINPQNPDIIFVASREGLFRSMDAGKSWSKIDFRRDLKFYAQIFEMKVSKEGILYLSTTEKLLVSNDDGTHFEDVGLQYSKNCRVFFGVNTIYLSMWKDATSPLHILLKSSDNGKTWKDISNGLNSHLVTAVAVNPKDENVIFVGTTDTSGEIEHPHNETGIFRSIDGGLHWENVGFYDTVHALAVDPVNTNIVYAGIDSGLLKSVDSGKTWSKVQLDDNNNKDIPIYAITIDPSSSTIYLGTGGAIYRIKEE